MNKNMKKINIQNKWALICSHTSVDMNTNLLSIFNVIEEVTINRSNNPLPELPKDGFVVPMQHEFVSFWSRDISESDGDLKIKAKLKLFDPKKELLQEQDLEIFFEKGKKSLRCIIKIGAIKVRASGEYTYEIDVYDENVSPIKVDTQVNIKFA